MPLVCTTSPSLLVHVATVVAFCIPWGQHFFSAAPSDRTRSVTEGLPPCTPAVASKAEYVGASEDGGGGGREGAK